MRGRLETFSEWVSDRFSDGPSEWLSGRLSGDDGSERGLPGRGLPG